MLDLPGEWSGLAMRVIDSFSKKPSILDFYHWHWLAGGKSKYRGFRKAPDGIGMATYEQFRMRLLENGFPDLSDDMFDSSELYEECLSKDLLEKVLTEWSRSSEKQRARFRKKMIDCNRNPD